MRVGAQTGMEYPFRRFLAAVGENNPRFRAVSRKEALSLPQVWCSPSRAWKKGEKGIGCKSRTVPLL